MKRGEQAKLIRELKEEHNLNPSKTIISRMIKEKDYRIVLTPGGNIKIPETIKALLDSDFGKHGQKMKDKMDAKKGKPAAEVKTIKAAKESTENGDTVEYSEIDVQNYIDADGKLKTTAPRPVVARYKEMQSAEKDRIKNETSLKTLVNFDDVSGKVFNFLRPLRDDIQDIAKRVSAIVYQTGSKREAEKVINDEINRILISRVGEDYKSDDDLKKKIIKALMT